jgi:hypothetical protein
LTISLLCLSIHRAASSRQAPRLPERVHPEELAEVEDFERRYPEEVSSSPSSTSEDEEITSAPPSTASSPARDAIVENMGVRQRACSVVVNYGNGYMSLWACHLRVCCAGADIETLPKHNDSMSNNDGEFDEEDEIQSGINGKNHLSEDEELHPTIGARRYPTRNRKPPPAWMIVEVGTEADGIHLFRCHSN